MRAESKRLTYFNERVTADQSSLFGDIALWQQALSGDRPIWYHVSQFQALCRRAIDSLTAQYHSDIGGPQDNLLTFQSTVYGALGAQWMLLRQVAAQHLPGSPYSKALDDLSKQAGDYYYQLRGAVPDQVHLSPTPPLVYLGQIADLTLFNQAAPTILSLPFGATTDEPSRQALPHEVAHAVFNQIPGFISELELGFTHHMDEEIKPDPRQRVVYDVIGKWLNEIVADMAATALADKSYVHSAYKIMITPDEMVSITDPAHPLPAIRPYTHLATLKYLHGPDDQDVKDLGSEIEELFESQYRARRFELAPELTVVSLEMLKDAMLSALEFMFGNKLNSLGNQSLGEILHTAAGRVLDVTQDIENRELFPSWGNMGDENEFVLRLIGPLRPEHATPISFTNICCLLGLRFCCPTR